MYLTPAKEGFAEYIDKKSRFIGMIRQVTCEEEAKSFLDSVRRTYPDATHHVWAYVLHTGGAMRFSDDGEPGGTAGMPVLNVLRTSEMQDICCVVTRYFGGILLGSGGLVRAYSKAAAMALEDAGTARIALWKQIEFHCAYNLYDRIIRIMDSIGCVVEQTDFGSDVCVSAVIKNENTEQLKKTLTDLSGGMINVMETGTCFRPETI